MAAMATGSFHLQLQDAAIRTLFANWKTKYKVKYPDPAKVMNRKEGLLS